jgi:nucleobase transporter 1/2
LNSMRNLIIIGLTLFLGISIPQLFNQSSSPSRPGYVHTKAGWVSFLL